MPGASSWTFGPAERLAALALLLTGCDSSTGPSEEPQRAALALSRGSVWLASSCPNIDLTDDSPIELPIGLPAMSRSQWVENRLDGAVGRALSEDPRGIFEYGFTIRFEPLAVAGRNTGANSFSIGCRDSDLLAVRHEPAHCWIARSRGHGPCFDWVWHRNDPATRIWFDMRCVAQ